MAFGAYHVFTVFIAFFSISFQKSMFQMMPEFNQGVPFDLDLIYDQFMIFLPFLAMIGILMVLLGWKLELVIKNSVKYNLIITALLLIWMLALLLSIPNVIDTMLDKIVASSGGDTPHPIFFNLIKGVFWGAMIFNLIIVLIPQVIIHFKLKKLSSADSEIPSEL